MQTMNTIPSPYVIPGLRVMPTKDTVINAICSYYHVDTANIFTKQKHNKSEPRKMAMYFMYTFLEMTYKSIGEVFKVDHTTIMHSVRYVHQMLCSKREHQFKADVSKINEMLYPLKPKNGTTDQ